MNFQENQAKTYNFVTLYMFSNKLKPASVLLSCGKAFGLKTLATQAIL